MARKFIRRFIPHPDKIHSYRALRIFGPALRRPYLWHLNRRSVSRAFAIGLFWMLIPMPWQMIPSAACAIIMRANIPLSLALVWISNPLTWGPIYFITYQVGRMMMGGAPAPKEEMVVVGEQPTFWSFDLAGWWEWTATNFWSFVAPLYLGSFVCGVTLAGVSFLAADRLWRWHVARRWLRRKGRGFPVTPRSS